MINRVFGFSIIWFLLFAAQIEASFVIKLKNGKEILTSRYWHEGGQILFDAYGGVLGVDKASVVAIEKSNKAIPGQRNAQVRAEAKASEAFAGEMAGEAKKALPPAEEKTSARNPDDPILKEFSALQEKFRGLNRMLTAEMVELARELIAFKNKVQTSRKTNDYLNEFIRVHEMANETEAALKSRNQ